MRKLPRDEQGSELSPPRVQPDYDKRRLKSKEIALVTQVRHYELITPLFGGGVVPGEADPVTLIRGPAIRGQLRFWWRVCRGGQSNGDLWAMKAREDELWGAASTEKKPCPSQVQIRLEITGRGQTEQPFVTRTRPSPNWRDLAYAAFPLQDKTPPGKVVVGPQFMLTLTFPQKHQAEVEAALWAWETFGGVGARTRRGFGALKLVSVNGKPVTPPRTAKVESEIRRGLRQHVVDGEWPAGVPHLSRKPEMKVTKRQGNPDAAWKYLITRLKKFRQARHPGTLPKQPGRSKWPEPDAIRRLMGQRSTKHPNDVLNINKFPRAAFGLPVVFHFKDKDDPQDTILQRKDYDRLASPLILRPLACADGAVGLALILEGTGLTELPGELVLKVAEKTVTAVLDKAEAGEIEPLGGDPDVLSAFLKTL